MALGPFAYLRRSWRWAAFLLLLCVLLTLLSQVGGVVLWLSIPFLAGAAQRLAKWNRAAAALEAVTMFLLIYGVVSLLVVPPLAALGGRVPMPCFGGSEGAAKSRSFLYCALNRHYVRRDLRTLVEDLASDIARVHPGARVRTLDAGFPFLDGFPMLPHSNRRHGTVVDLALFYRDAQGRAAPSPSPLGYGVYARRHAGQACDDRAATSRWGMGWLQASGSDTMLDENVTRDALRWLSGQPTVDRLSIDPPLRERLEAGGAAGQVHGCEAAPQGDHVHVQIKR